MGVMRNQILKVYIFQYLDILKNPIYPSKTRPETLRLFFERFWYLLPIISINKCSNFHFSLISQRSHFWNYPNFLRINLGINLGSFVRHNVHQFAALANRQIHHNLILWTHSEQDVPDNKKKRRQWICRYDRSQAKAWNT